MVAEIFHVASLKVVFYWMLFPIEASQIKLICQMANAVELKTSCWAYIITELDLYGGVTGFRQLYTIPANRVNPKHQHIHYDDCLCVTICQVWGLSFLFSYQTLKNFLIVFLFSDVCIHGIRSLKWKFFQQLFDTWIR